MRVSTLVAGDVPRPRGTRILSYLTIPLPLLLPLPQLLSGCLVLLRKKTIGGLYRVAGCDLVLRVPLTCPWRTRCRCPHHQRFLGGFQCTSYRVPVEENEEKWVGLLLRLGVVVGCYPAENPLASGGRVGRFPRGGSGAFTHSSGLLQAVDRRFTLYNTVVHC